MICNYCHKRIRKADKAVLHQKHCAARKGVKRG